MIESLRLIESIFNLSSFWGSLQSDYKVKTIIRFFSANVDVTKASILLDFNWKTMNRSYPMFRECIYIKQPVDKAQFYGTAELPACRRQG